MFGSALHYSVGLLVCISLLPPLIKAYEIYSLYFDFWETIFLSGTKSDSQDSTEKLGKVIRILNYRHSKIFSNVHSWCTSYILELLAVSYKKYHNSYWNIFLYLDVLLKTLIR